MPAATVEAFNMVKILVVVVVNNPDVKVKLFEILMGVEFKITPPFVLFITIRVVSLSLVMIKTAHPNEK